MENFLITRDGKIIDPSLYTWDKHSRTLTTKEAGLTLDFSGIDNIIFNTGSNCIFLADINCIFNTGNYCMFNTSSYCTFNTGHNCMFRTGSGCIFSTGSMCMFDTDSGCIFETNSDCIFRTGSSCTFKTEEKCVIIRRDVDEVIEIPENIRIRLNDYKVKEYTIVSIETITDRYKRYYINKIMKESQSINR